MKLEPLAEKVWFKRYLGGCSGLSRFLESKVKLVEKMGNCFFGCFETTTQNNSLQKAVPPPSRRRGPEEKRLQKRDMEFSFEESLNNKESAITMKAMLNAGEHKASPKLNLSSLQAFAGSVANRIPRKGQRVNKEMIQEFKMGVYLILLFDYPAVNLHDLHPMKSIFRMLQSAASFTLYYLIVSSLPIKLRNKLAKSQSTSENLKVSNRQNSSSKQDISESSAGTKEAIQKTSSHHLSHKSQAKKVLKGTEPYAGIDLDSVLSMRGIEIGGNSDEVTFNILMYLQQFGKNCVENVTERMFQLPDGKGDLFILNSELIGTTALRKSLTRREQSLAEMENPAECFMDLINQAGYVMSLMVSTTTANKPLDEAAEVYVAQNGYVPGLDDTENLSSIFRKLDMGNPDGLHLFPRFEGHILVNELFTAWLDNNMPWIGGLSMFHLNNTEDKSKEEKFSLLFRQWYEHQCAQAGKSDI